MIVISVLSKICSRLVLSQSKLVFADDDNSLANSKDPIKFQLNITSAASKRGILS